jgi:hypothetical protein
MDNDRPARQLKPLPALVWAATLAAIPLFSLFGRPLQHWALEAWGRDGLALTLALLFAGAGVAFVARVARAIPQAALLSLALALALAAIIQGVPTVEERMHFLLFGALAYSGVKAFGWVRAVVVVAVMAFADEGLQSLLPSRVGDLRDVWMNLLGGAIGLALAQVASWLGRDR